MVTELEERANSQGDWLSGMRDGSSEEELPSFFPAQVRRSRLERKEDDDESSVEVLVLGS